MFCALLSVTVKAQDVDEHKEVPLHVGVSLGAGTSCKEVLPMEASIDLSYYYKNLSIFAISQTGYFIPQNGLSCDYNRSTNLGGGIGYLFFPSDDTKLGNFGIRAFVTTSLKSSDYKNTSYNVGINWYGQSSNRALVPLVGVGYNFKDFSKRPGYHGAYFSFGIRF